MSTSRAITFLGLELFSFTYTTENEENERIFLLTAGNAEIGAGCT